MGEASFWHVDVYSRGGNAMVLEIRQVYIVDNSMQWTLLPGVRNWHKAQV